MQIYDMKVNHLTNPLGFRMPRTVFSWKVKEAEGRRQEAAEYLGISTTSLWRKMKKYGIAEKY